MVISASWQHSWRIHSLFFVLLCALICYHPIVQRRVVARFVSIFERECKVSFDSQEATFHPLTGSLVFKRVAITKNGSERPLLMAQQGSLSFAPVQSMLCLKLIFESSIVGMRIPVGQGIEGVLDVVDFFKALLASSSPYVALRGLKLSEISMGDIQAQVHVESGTEQSHQSPDLSVMQGDLCFPVIPSVKVPVRIGKLVVGIPLGSGTRRFVGELFGRADKSFFVVREGEHLKALVEYNPERISYRAILPVDDIAACVDGLFPDKKVLERYAPYRSFGKAQDVLLKLRGVYVPEQRSGKMEFASSHYRSQEITSIHGMVIHKDFQVLCDTRCVLREGLSLKGRLFADARRKSMKAFLFNDNPSTVFFGKALIPRRGFGLLVKSGTLGNFIGRYTLNAHDPEYHKQVLVGMGGIFSVHDEQLCLAGKLNKKTMYGLGTFSPGARLRRLVILDEKNNIDVDVKSSGEHDEHLSGEISRHCMRHIIPREARLVMGGDGGNVAFELNQGLMPVKLSGSVSLVDSNYCFFGCSNPLISARASFDLDFMLKAATVSDIECVYSSGLMSSKEALLNWSSDGISYLHLPVVVSDVFINKDKDFCAIVDGECSMDWIDGGAHRIDGAFVIKKSLINSPAFAGSSSGRSFVMSPHVEGANVQKDLKIDANISIKTLEPTVITMPILHTRAHVDARLGGYVRGDGSLHPKVSGTVRLDGGVLDVLGRPLRIMKGTIDLLPNQSDNPIIDFLAYTHVKQYKIAIHGSGSLLQPSFVFESNPPLSQEQIIGLVLSGSEYSDINQQLPGIFLQSIHKVIAPGEQSAEKSAFFQSLVKSLRYIQLLPYQDSISSQKTVKARLNIDLGPHLRALVHKDIFGKEAVALQVEYDVSDELNLRLLRQSSGQVGAEAEVRFKF